LTPRDQSADRVSDSSLGSRSARLIQPAKGYTNLLEEGEILINMSSYDIAKAERFMRTLEEEEV